jgi:hypothetical protein
MFDESASVLATPFEWAIRLVSNPSCSREVIHETK